MTDRLTILQGDWIEQLRLLEDESVQCCVTSPPYWGLRDYGTSTWEGGDAECDHQPERKFRQFKNGQGEISTGTSCMSWTTRDATPKNPCPKCGAKRIDAQLGLEKTPEEYVAKMVAGFREVRRVLRSDGTLWINLGDSYNSNQGAGFDTNQDGGDRKRLAASPKLVRPSWLKPKDLVGIPWLCAFALRADGWWLRQDIIWAKPNPMPESVTDRCTKAHEYLFLLTKSARYYFDAEAIAEPVSPSMMAQVMQGYNGSATKDFAASGAQDASATKSRILAKHRKPAGWDTKPGAHGTIHRKGRAPDVEYQPTEKILRNKRSVWTIPTAPYPEAHFATYPPDLIKPCILAGSKPGDTIIDPFGGSGTTAMVALELGRKAILIELNPDYIPLIERRCDVTPGLAL